MRERASTFLTAQGEIQLALGELGDVLEYVQQSNRTAGYPSVGWYARLAFELERCSCDKCRATRAGRPGFLAGRRLEAIEDVGVYKHEHPEILEQLRGDG